MCLRFLYDVAVIVMSNLASGLVLGAFGRLQSWFASSTGAEAEAEDGGTPGATIHQAAPHAAKRISSTRARGLAAMETQRCY